jgi:hypothetical protein
MKGSLLSRSSYSISIFQYGTFCDPRVLLRWRFLSSSGIHHADRIALFACIARLSFVYAAPLKSQNGTETHYAPPWVEESSGRGTWSILYCCMFTIGLCVWSAIHLNLPYPDEPRSHQSWRKVKWVFIAIFAPEFVLYSAWQQFYQAQKLYDELNRLASDERIEGEENEKPVQQKNFGHYGRSCVLCLHKHGNLLAHGSIGA